MASTHFIESKLLCYGRLFIHDAHWRVRSAERTPTIASALEPFNAEWTHKRYSCLPTTFTASGECVLSDYSDIIAIEFTEYRYRATVSAANGHSAGALRDRSCCCETRNPRPDASAVSGAASRSGAREYALLLPLLLVRFHVPERLGGPLEQWRAPVQRAVRARSPVELQAAELVARAR